MYHRILTLSSLAGGIHWHPVFQIDRLLNPPAAGRKPLMPPIRSSKSSDRARPQDAC
ncbi:MAG: hypothetical protein WCT06_05135 [Armatimonadota bacterium]